jgi:hypothetical protein
MRTLRYLLPAIVLSLALLAAACSPEANRTRGGKGADIGNRPSQPSDVELHGVSNPSYQVPTVGQAVQKERR